jgi:hypothetical protein
LKESHDVTVSKQSGLRHGLDIPHTLGAKVTMNISSSSGVKVLLTLVKLMCCCAVGQGGAAHTTARNCSEGVVAERQTLHFQPCPVDLDLKGFESSPT